MLEWITGDCSLAKWIVKQTITLVNTLVQASITSHLDGVMLIDHSDSTLRPLLSTLLSMDHNIFIIWLHFPFNFLLANSASAPSGNFAVLGHVRHTLDRGFCTCSSLWISLFRFSYGWLPCLIEVSKSSPQSRGAVLTWWLARWTQTTQSDFEITTPLSSYALLGKFLSHLVCLFPHL